MSLLNIIIAPDPILKRSCKAVDCIDSDISKLMIDMLDTMRHAPGLGLAAPQVGVNKRVIVVDACNKSDISSFYKIANPEIIWSSDDKKDHEEGCLSFPKYYEMISRPDKIKLKYLDENNETQVLEADGLLSVVIQHEIDHLNGIVFVDHISSLKRGMIIRKLRKYKKSIRMENK